MVLYLSVIYLIIYLLYPTFDRCNVDLTRAIIASQPHLQVYNAPATTKAPVRRLASSLLVGSKGQYLESRAGTGWRLRWRWWTRTSNHKHHQVLQQLKRVECVDYLNIRII